MPTIYHLNLPPPPPGGAEDGGGDPEGSGDLAGDVRPDVQTARDHRVGVELDLSSAYDPSLDQNGAFLSEKTSA